MSRHPRHFIALDECSAAELSALLDDAQRMAVAWRARSLPQSLAGRRVALVVDDDGWRNTFAFDLGIQALGGISAHAPVGGLGRREAVVDLAAYLGNWADAVVVRTPGIAALHRLAAVSHVPVINARTRHNHPCETLGDLAFLQSARESIEGLRVAVVAPDANILRSWIEASTVLPLHVTQVYPQAWHAAATSARFTAVADPSAVAGADVLVTDCWPADAEPRTLAPYRVDPAMLARLAPAGVFLPCPPVHRGEEVDDAAMRHPACRVIEAKAWLMHAQNAVLRWLMPA